MGAFADTLFSVLLSWVKSAVGSLVTLFQSGGDRGILAWLGNNWLLIVLVLVAGGLVMDWLIWLVRWQPYHIWATRARRVKRGLLRMLGFGRNKNEENVSESSGEYLSEAPTRIVPAVHEEPPQLDEAAQQMAFERAQAVPEEVLGAYPGQRYDVQTVYQAQPAYDEQPIYQVQPAYDEQPVYQPQPAYDEQPIYQAQPAYDEQPIYQAQPAYDEQPLYQPQPAYDEQPVYQPQPAYGEQPLYQPQPAYDEQPVYQPQPAYDEQPVYQPQPAYDEQPVYQPQPAYGEQPEAAEPAVDHKSLRQVYGRPVSEDAEASQELVPGVDPFAPYDAPEVLEALEARADRAPQAQSAQADAEEEPSRRRRRRQRTSCETQTPDLSEEAPSPEETVSEEPIPEEAAPAPEAQATSEAAYDGSASADDLPEPPQWPDWEQTAVHPVARMDDIRVPGTRAKPSMVDRLRERVEKRGAGGEKKRSRIANFFDPREEPVKGLAPRVSKEEAFAKPVRPDDEDRP